MSRIVNVFISYAHEDRAWCSRLRDQLGALVNLGQIHLFDDGEIRPGERWDERIRHELESADIMVLIVSDKFLASKYSTTVELQHAVEGRSSRSLCVIPVIADHVDIGALPFRDLQLFPLDDNRDLRPLVDWKGDSSKALAEIARYVRHETERVREGGEGQRARPAVVDARASMPVRQQAARRPQTAVLAGAALLLVAGAAYWGWQRPAEPSPAVSSQTGPVTGESPVVQDPAPSEPVTRPTAKPPAGKTQVEAGTKPPARTESPPPAIVGTQTPPADAPQEAAPPKPPAPSPEEARQQLFARADSIVQCVKRARNDGLTLQVLKIVRASPTSETTSGLIADLNNAWPGGVTEGQQREIVDKVNCIAR